MGTGQLYHFCCSQVPKRVQFPMTELIPAFVIGLIGGAIPGPLLTSTFTEILQSGFRKSIWLVTIAMLVEALVAYICLFALTLLSISPNIFYLLTLFGAGFLLHLAAKIWKIQKFDTSTRIVFNLKRISLLILSNGMLWLFWISVIIPQALAYSHGELAKTAIYFLCVQTGVFISTLAIGFIFSRFRPLLSKPTVVPYIFKVFALAFIFFALRMAYTAVTALF